MSRSLCAQTSIGAAADAGVAPEPALPDPPPTPLQVVEYYDSDALGSIRAVTDQQGQVVARHDFLPFGEELNPQTPPHDKKLFTGQERDFETAQDYFNARQLRTDLGRLLIPDPIALLPIPSVAGAVKGMADALLGSNPYLKQQVEGTIGTSVLEIGGALSAARGRALQKMTMGGFTKLAAKVGARTVLLLSLAGSMYEALKQETRAYKEGRCHF